MSDPKTTKFFNFHHLALFNANELIDNGMEFYRKSIDMYQSFGGPSVYFHQEAIKAQQAAFLSDRHIEMIYATLASWGMHRMGDPVQTKAKLLEFSRFKVSVLKHESRLREMKPRSMAHTDPDTYEWMIEQLKEIYMDLEVSASEASLVANSKTLAHILPDLIPPIDRQYTIRFLTQDHKAFKTKSGTMKTVPIPSGDKEQFLRFKTYCCAIKFLFDECREVGFTVDGSNFNTSYPKIMDNMIMAFVKKALKSSSLKEHRNLL